MSAPAALRRGWCPGALRPMPTGDGLLVRLRITGGIVPATLARAVADCARNFGNGLVDLSARANLQLRGVSEATLPGLTERLSELGLLDSDPEGEAVRNVIASPLAGLDPTAVLDIRPIVTALEARIAGDRGLRRLPQKFGFLVDDGGALGLPDLSMDVRFEAVGSPMGPRFEVALGGTAAAARPVGSCAPADVPKVAAALARAFLARGGTGPDAPRRMRDLLGGREQARRDLLTDLESALLRPPASRAEHPDDPAGRRIPVPVLGPNRAGDLAYLGLAAPFGRLSAGGLDRLAATAEGFGNGESRLTPWRAVLLPGVVSPSASAGLGPGFILAEDDPRRRVAACPGAPGCANGSTPTQDDGAALAPLAARLAASGIALHVSGCRKGCALPGPAPVTLVGRDGRYDLVREGAAADAPVRLGLTLAEVRGALMAMAEGPVPA